MMTRPPASRAITASLSIRGWRSSSSLRVVEEAFERLEPELRDSRDRQLEQLLCLTNFRAVANLPRMQACAPAAATFESWRDAPRRDRRRPNRDALSWVRLLGGGDGATDGSEWRGVIEADGAARADNAEVAPERFEIDRMG